MDVYDKEGNNIALGKNVTILQGNSTDDASLITNGYHTGSFVTIQPISDEILETIVRVDLGEEYTNIDYVTLWRLYNYNQIYYNTRLFGRDANKRLTWKFHSYKIEGVYPETSSGYTSYMSYEADYPQVVPMIDNVTLNPTTDTNEGVKVTIEAKLEEGTSL